MKTLINLIIYMFPMLLMGQYSSIDTIVTSGQIIQTIIKNTGSAPILNTVDIIKEGDPDTPVKGIITCMFATMDVLRKAVDENCNLIIVHEPLYYNHLDKTEEFQNDSVFLEKRQFIDDHKLVVWRFHDYIHSMEPDGILSGMVIKLGWGNYIVDDHLNQFSFPETTLIGLLENLKKTFPENAFYVVGNPAMKVSNVRFVPGAAGSMSHIRLLRDENVDVVMAGEVSQWETYEYVRDAVEQGRNKAIIFIGHISSEEGGMDFCAEWLKKFIKNIPILYVECGSSFWTF